MRAGHALCERVRRVTGMREWSLRAAAQAMHRDPSTIRRLIADGELKAYRDGRAWRIPEWAIEEYQRERVGRGRPAQHEQE